MRRARTGQTRHNRILSNNTTFVASAIFTLVGALLCVPFVFDVFIFQHGYAHITIFPLLEIFGVVIGSPLFLVGLVSFSDVSSYRSSTSDVDVARIRFAAEQEMNRKNK